MDEILMAPDASPGKPSQTASHSNSWPPAYLAALRQHVADGLSSPAIAALPMFKRHYSRGAIIGMAARLGLKWAGSRQKAAAAPEPPPPPRPNKYRKTKLEDVRTPDQALAPLNDVDNGAEIFSLRLNDCRYITAGEGLEATYCRQPTVGTGSWCAVHEPLVFGRTR